MDLKKVILTGGMFAYFLCNSSTAMILTAVEEESRVSGLGQELLEVYEKMGVTQGSAKRHLQAALDILELPEQQYRRMDISTAAGLLFRALAAGTIPHGRSQVELTGLFQLSIDPHISSLRRDRKPLTKYDAEIFILETLLKTNVVPHTAFRTPRCSIHIRPMYGRLSGLEPS